MCTEKCTLRMEQAAVLYSHGSLTPPHCGYSTSPRVIDGNPLAVHVLRKQFQNTDNVHVVAPAVTIGSGTGGGESYTRLYIMFIVTSYSHYINFDGLKSYTVT